MESQFLDHFLEGSGGGLDASCEQKWREEKRKEKKREEKVKKSEKVKMSIRTHKTRVRMRVGVVW